MFMRRIILGALAASCLLGQETSPLSGRWGGLTTASLGASFLGVSSDGYVSGERVTVHRPASLFFDTISATYGYLGDLDAPGMQRRFHRLEHVNFRQYLVSKRIGRRVEASLQYTNQWGVKTLHE